MGRKLRRKQKEVERYEGDEEKVYSAIEQFNIVDIEGLPEDLLELVCIEDTSQMETEEIHIRMGYCSYQKSYLEQLRVNAEINVRELERLSIQIYNDAYEGNNKKMNAENAQLDSGILEQLDVARGIAARITIEATRIEDIYRFYSRVLSSRQGGL